MRLGSMAAVLLCAGSLAACGRNKQTDAADGKKITIGLAMDTLKEARWQRDRDLFVARAEALGARVLVQAANGDDALQNSQAENLLTQGVDVLVVVPHNAKTAATIVESAHRSNVPVISYDRLILDSDVDLYISVDPTRVGELQGEYAVKHKPKGNYVLIGGAPTDNNARLVRNGQMTALKPAVDRGDVKVVTDQWAKEWQPVEALKIMENALTRTGNKVDAVVSPTTAPPAGPSRPWPSRSWRARYSSPARTPTSPPASASWPAHRR